MIESQMKVLLQRSQVEVMGYQVVLALLRFVHECKNAQAECAGDNFQSASTALFVCK